MTPQLDGGFATPAAVMISLVIATLAVAVQVRAVAALHLGETDLQRAQAELMLDGVQDLAGARLLGGAAIDGAPAGMQVDVEQLTVRGEPESPKLSLAAAAQLDAATLSAIGASRTDEVRRGLERLAASPDTDADAVSDLDPAPRWRACSRSMISPYGAGLALSSRPAPGAGAAASAHLGEIWRLVVSDPNGWTDDRIVRLIGLRDQATRTLDRRFYRRRSGDPQCAV